MTDTAKRVPSSPDTAQEPGCTHSDVAGGKPVGTMVSSRPVNSPALHTPGPWRSHGAGGEIHGNSRVVATMTWCSGMGDEDDANARLIAAAPDMLSVLQFFACIDFDNFTEHDEALLDDVKRDARAAIVRATGNSQ